ncbi:MAG: ATP-binding protein [Lachnospiraceae bacterium]|nr:ATP-binding protein [Lachnospiraceae bacterium]
MEKKRLPVGVDDFADFHQMRYYYIDKTGMIKELLENPGKVNLFTRPRRFGKSLIMSMLKYFFEIGTDKSLFDDLMISKEKKLCEEYMGQFPVIAITLKQVAGETMSEARKQLWESIMEAADNFDFLQESEKLSGRDKLTLQKLSEGSGNLEASLKQLSRILCKHYGRKVIILIDEYDAPLQKAYENGYYDRMVKMIRQFFGYALKSNNALYFSVLTGVMRVSKESIFSDLNNPDVHSMVDPQYGEWFGFTDAEVRQMLDAYDLQEYYAITKGWYDGYRMGKAGNIYCPWDVVKWCKALLADRDAMPENFWENVSENECIRTFAQMADSVTRDDIAHLLSGGTVNRKLIQELTYRNMTESLDNIWSLLFTTGYLTQRGRNDDGTYELCIPNREVCSIFKTKIEEWFTDKILEDTDGLKTFYAALDAGDAEALEDCLNYHLGESISYVDGGTYEDKETFYQGILLGMLRSRKDWEVRSNREAGKGRPDITIFNIRQKKAYIIEVKYSKKEEDLPSDAQEGLEQINRLNYDQYFSMRFPNIIRHFGVAFCKKQCKAVAE